MTVLNKTQIVGSGESLDGTDFRCQITSLEMLLWENRDCTLEEFGVDESIGRARKDRKRPKSDAVWRFTRANRWTLLLCHDHRLNPHWDRPVPELDTHSGMVLGRWRSCLLSPTATR